MSSIVPGTKNEQSRVEAVPWNEKKKKCYKAHQVHKSESDMIHTHRYMGEKDEAMPLEFSYLYTYLR